MSRLFVTLQYLLPHHLLCRLVYALTRCRAPWLKNLLIGSFMRGYHPVMDDALEPEPLRYDSFNAFFTRALTAQARPLADAAVVCPCDGTVSVATHLEDNMLLQAKGHEYSLEALLGAQDPQWVERLRGGSFATLYLAPYNYHRVHMPLAGRLIAAWHVPGRLFSVNAATAARVPGLFARNERVVCCFEGESGPFVVVLVGALFVGSMSTVWHGDITPWRGSAGRGVHRLTPSTPVPLQQPVGAELGRFNMGSTVILLLPPGAPGWQKDLVPGKTVRVGQPLSAP